MSEKPLISVIVPVYNCEKYIKKCIDSIRQQTYNNLEIILVDDGSDDNSLTLCKEKALFDKRIKVFHKKNGGASSARNLGLEKANGEYIGFVDSDDYIDPDMYKELLNILITNKLYIVSSKIRSVDLNHQILGEANNTKEINILNYDDTIKYFFNHSNYSMCTRLIHKSVFENLRFIEGHCFEDCLMTFEIYLKIKHSCYYQNTFYNYLERPNSVTRKKIFGKKERDSIFGADYIYDLVKEKCPKYKDYAIKFKYSIYSAMINRISKNVLIDNYSFCKELAIKIKINLSEILFAKKLKFYKKLILLLYLINYTLPNKIYIKLKR